MRHYPIFLDLTGSKIVFSGAGDIAVAKVRLLMKTPAQIHVFGENPHSDILRWSSENKLFFHSRSVMQSDLLDAKLLYVANGDESLDKVAKEYGRSLGILTNVVDDLHSSDFLTPALVDRAPVTVAIGSEGTAPVLARKIKSEIEELLPSDIGILARIAQDFRPVIARWHDSAKRRRFWQKFFFESGPLALSQSGEAGARRQLSVLYDEIDNNDKSPMGYVSLIGTGDGDPELLPLKSRKRLFSADIVLYESSVDIKILELARREAKLVLLDSPLSGSIFDEALQGFHIVYLSSGTGGSSHWHREQDILAHRGIRYEKILGIGEDSVLQLREAS